MIFTNLSLAHKIVNKDQLLQRLEHEYLTTGFHNINHSLEGLPRGAITEIYGASTTGKTSFLQGFLAHSTREGEFCALVDSQDSFHPGIASQAGTDLRKLLWVRCRQPEESIQAADLLVHSGGWGVVTLDLGNISPRWLQRLPPSYWYRFRRAVESTPTVLLVLTHEPTLKTCAAMSLEMHPARAVWSGNHPDFRILKGTHSHLTARKPFQGGSADFFVKATA